MEDAVQLLTGHIALAGLAMTLVGGVVGWPGRLRYRNPGSGVFGLYQPLTILGLVVAFVGLILFVIGLALHPLY